MRAHRQQDSDNDNGNEGLSRELSEACAAQEVVLSSGSYSQVSRGVRWTDASKHDTLVRRDNMTGTTWQNAYWTYAGIQCYLLHYGIRTLSPSELVKDALDDGRGDSLIFWPCGMCTTNHKYDSAATVFQCRTCTYSNDAKLVHAHAASVRGLITCIDMHSFGLCGDTYQG